MTGLKRTRDEIGAMYLPDVLELLDYWLEFPPEHMLLRALVGYEGTKKKGRPQSNWSRRKKRAQEMQDEIYAEAEAKPEEPEESELDRRIRQTTISGAKHLDCAPGHVQQAIERLKKNRHLEIPDMPAVTNG